MPTTFQFDLLGGEDELPPPVHVGVLGVLPAEELADLARRELGLADVAKVPREMDRLACKQWRESVGRRAVGQTPFEMSEEGERKLALHFPMRPLTPATNDCDDRVGQTAEGKVVPQSVTLHSLTLTPPARRDPFQRYHHSLPNIWPTVQFAQRLWTLGQNMC